MLDGLDAVGAGASCERLLDDYDGDGGAARARPRRPRPRRRARTRSRRARETPDRPTVIFAYTIKGYGLEIAGRPQNHSALLTGAQIDAPPRASRASTLETEWDGFAPGTRGGTAARGRPPSGSTAADRRCRGRDRACPRRCPTRDPARDVDAGGVRAHAARPLPRRGRRRAARHGRAGRLDLDQPRRLHQQDRRLGARRGARLRRDGGLAAEVARRPDAASTSRWASPR